MTGRHSITDEATVDAEMNHHLQFIDIVEESFNKVIGEEGDAESQRLKARLQVHVEMWKNSTTLDAFAEGISLVKETNASFVVSPYLNPEVKKLSMDFLLSLVGKGEDRDDQGGDN